MMGRPESTSRPARPGVVLAMAMAVMLAGCGGAGNDASPVTKTSGETAKRRREMEDFMKNSKQAAGPATKVRDHP